MTQEEHRIAIREAIRAAELDGFEVAIMNECCGCSRMSLEIGPAGCWDGTENVVVIGERR